MGFYPCSGRVTSAAEFAVPVWGVALDASLALPKRELISSSRGNGERREGERASVLTIQSPLSERRRKAKDWANVR